MKDTPHASGTEEEKFDERFGRKGPEGNCDSIGRNAGCDDCVSNIELREEHRKFLKESNAKARESVVKEFKVMQERYPEFALDLEFYDGDVLVNTTRFERIPLTASDDGRDDGK